MCMNHAMLLTLLHSSTRSNFSYEYCVETCWMNSFAVSVGLTRNDNLFCVVFGCWSNILHTALFSSRYTISEIELGIILSEQFADYQDHFESIGGNCVGSKIRFS